VKENNIVREKSYKFALTVIELYRLLTTTKNEYVLAKQILRSGTSIGANIEEAIGGQSKKDFVAKIAVAYKEARETEYWLRLLRDSGYLANDEINPIIVDCQEILKLLGSIQKTLKSTS